MQPVDQQPEKTDIPVKHDVVIKGTELEAAWLWFAGTVNSDTARRYCLEQALHANPESQPARQALAAMIPQPAAETHRPAVIWRLSWLFRRWGRWDSNPQPG